MSGATNNGDTPNASADGLVEPTWRQAHDEFCLSGGFCFTAGSNDSATRSRIAGLKAAAPLMPREAFADPIPMILTCPSCSARHIDEGEFETKPHHTHACQSCGMVWRPAKVKTVGVRFLPGYSNEEPRP